MPGLYDGLERMRASNFDPNILHKEFGILPKISIDYGIMEKTDDLVVVRGNFKWDDIGTWDSLDRILERDKNGNIIQTEFLGIDVKNSIFFSEKPIIGYTSQLAECLVFP